MKVTVFCLARAPELNKVKSRIAIESDAQIALSVYEKLLNHTLAILSGLPSEWDIRLAVDGYIPVSWRQRFDGFTCIKQGQGDVGERMDACFKIAFAQGADVVALIGSDVPEFTSLHIINLALACQNKDCALIPALDGGYCAIALKSYHKQLFHGLDWSTDLVMDQTRKILSSLGLSRKEFAPLRDVDTLSDARHFQLID